MYRNIIECVSYSAKSALLSAFFCVWNGKKTNNILFFRVSIVSEKQVSRFFFG